MIKKFKKEFLKEVLKFEDEEIKLAMEAQRKFPQLLCETNDKDFVINGENLCIELGVKDDFTSWLLADRKTVTGKLIKYRCLENKDYTVNREISEKGGRPKAIITLTLNCAKKIAMRQNNEAGDLVCDYFLLMEKAVKGLQNHNAVREPERENYNKMKEAIISDYYNKHDNVTEFDKKSLMIRESNMINICLTGLKANEIRTKLGYKDIQTREHLMVEINKVINELELMIIGLVYAGVEHNERARIIKSICDNKYTHLKMA